VFLFVKDAQKQNPSQLRHVLHRAGAIPAPHDVADALDCLINRLLASQLATITIAIENLR
jgi:hypothetical protein